MLQGYEQHTGRDAESDSPGSNAFARCAGTASTGSRRARTTDAGCAAWRCQALPGAEALRLHCASVAGLRRVRRQNFNVGLSHFLPAGGVQRDATPLEKVYVVTEGEITIVTDDGEVTLHPYDSVYLAPNEARAIENRTNRPASMITVMPYPAPNP